MNLLSKEKNEGEINYIAAKQFCAVETSILLKYHTCFNLKKKQTAVFPYLVTRSGVKNLDRKNV